MSDRQCRVSLCMIVRDEQQNLAECLAPVADLFDEIVIVDTGSVDETKEIARRFTPHVYDFEWCDDFSAARNESLRHATGDWVFWLDADDRVRPEHIAALRELLNTQLDERQQVFLMDTVLVPAEPSGDTVIVTHLRLFRRNRQLQWEGRVHEQLQPDFATLGYKPVFTDIQIDHVGYQSMALRERKNRRKLRLLRAEYAVDPNNPSTLLHLAMALERTNRGEAKRHLLRLVEMGLDSTSIMRRVYYTLAELLLSEGKPGESAQFAERGLALFPDDEHLLFALASAKYVLEDFSAVNSALTQVINSPRSRHMYFGSVGDVRKKLAPRMLGAVQRMQKCYRSAEVTLEGVVRNYPGDALAWYNLGLVYLDQGDGQKLAPVVRRLVSLPRGNVEAGLLAALWYLRHDDPVHAGPIIDQLIAEAPEMPRPRMLRAEWLSRRQAPLSEQIKALRDVLRIHPGNMEARQWLRTAERVASAAPEPATSAWSTSVVAAGVPVG